MMNEEVKKCINNDIVLRNEYLKNKQNGASQEILDSIISQIVLNGEKYNELINIEVNEEQTEKHTIQKIEDCKEEISFYSNFFKLHGIMSGILALVTVGTLAQIIYLGGPTGGEVVLPVFTGMGTIAFTPGIVVSLIEKFKYKTEMKQLLEEYNRNNEEGMALK